MQHIICLLVCRLIYILFSLCFKRLLACTVIGHYRSPQNAEIGGGRAKKFFRRNAPISSPQTWLHGYAPAWRPPAYSLLYRFCCVLIWYWFLCLEHRIVSVLVAHRIVTCFLVDKHCWIHVQLNLHRSICMTAPLTYRWTSYRRCCEMKVTYY